MISAGEFRNGVTFDIDGNRVSRSSNSSTLSLVRALLS